MRFLFLYLWGVLAMLCPFGVAASELRIDANKASVYEGEQFVMDLVLHADESVNAFEGKIHFPADQLVLKEARDGSSVIQLWVERPHLVAEGEVSFSGVAPGGVSGPGQVLFSLVFEATHRGTATVLPSNVSILRHDGQGSRVDVPLRGMNIVIQRGDGQMRQEKMSDDDPPEAFTPEVIQKEDFFDGKWVVVFATQDKGSGIAGFWIKESQVPLLSWMESWTEVESPFVLRDQERKSRVLLKAIDHEGNERMVIIPPFEPLRWYEKLWWSILSFMNRVLHFRVAV